MIYKNKLKDYALISVLFGAPMGLMFGLMYFSAVIGLISGLACGVLFGFFMFLFSKFLEKKYTTMRAEIASQRRLICDGAATIKGIGGWMFFTELGLVFYPHKINFSTEQLHIPITSVRYADTKKRLLVISTAEGMIFDIVVCQNKAWAVQINGYVSSITNA